jgi:hypothetical protein
MTHLSDDDLEAAAAQGIVTAEQAAALRAFAVEREKARIVREGHEERFRFMRGFNDFFFAVGILLFAGGMGYFALPTPAGTLLAAAVTWLLAELLVGRLRLVLPGILLVCVFAFFLALAMPIDFWLIHRGHGFDLPALQDWFFRPRWFHPLPGGPTVVLSPGTLPSTVLALFVLSGAGAAAIFYARFRLPFALFVIGACLVGVARLAVNAAWPDADVGARSLVILGCGLLAFAAAMSFDLSDRERITRRADCAFWLHLLAAPLIVHSLISLVAPDVFAMTAPVASTVLAIFAVLIVVAVTIDRRALLVSALLYIGIVIAYGIKGTVGAQIDRQPFVFFATLLILGTVVLIIGVGWQPLRRALLRLLPASLTGRLPAPSAA